MITNYFKCCIMVNSFKIIQSTLYGIYADTYRDKPEQFWLALGKENLLDGKTHTEASVISSEITSTGYERYRINYNHGQGSNVITGSYFKFDNKSVFNRASFTFGTCPVNSNPWIDIRCWMLFDKKTGGNLLAYGSLIDDEDAKPIKVDPGTSVIIPSGAIEFRFEDVF